VEERTPRKPAPADTDSANPLRRAALIVVAVTILLFALSIVMERFTPSSSQAVVQAYVVRMAPEVAGRVIGVDVADNARVDAGQVLFRIDPRPFEIAVAEAQAQVEQIGQTLGASTAAVDSAQAKVVKETAELENVRAQTERVFELVKRGVYPASKADTARAAQDAARAVLTASQADLLPRRGKSLALRVLTIPSSRRRLRRWSVRGSIFFIPRSRPLPTAWSPISNLRPASSSGQGRPALTFIDLSTVWVSAEFKENSLEYMSASDRAELVFDSLPGCGLQSPRREHRLGRLPEYVDPNTGLPTIKNATGWVRDPQRFPVRLIVDETPPRGSVRVGSQVNVVVYAGNNPVTDALGAVFIRLISILTYAG
jgi:Multidrug resistance efflux pump